MQTQIINVRRSGGWGEEFGNVCGKLKGKKAGAIFPPKYGLKKLGKKMGKKSHRKKKST